MGKFTRIGLIGMYTLMCVHSLMSDSPVVMILGWVSTIGFVWTAWFIIDTIRACYRAYYCAESLVNRTFGNGR